MSAEDENHLIKAEEEDSKTVKDNDQPETIVEDNVLSPVNNPIIHEEETYSDEEELVDRRRRREIDSEKDSLEDIDDDVDDSIEDIQNGKVDINETIVEEETPHSQNGSEDGVWEEKDENGEQNKEEEGDGTIAKDSPMFIPKGRYYHHDSRCDPGTNGSDDDDDGNKEAQKEIPTAPCQVIEKWENDMYDPAKQKPREEWEKERDRKFYEELDRRRAAGETGDGTINKRGTRLGQYIPRRVQEGRDRRDNKGYGEGYKSNDRRQDWDRDERRREQKRDEEQGHYEQKNTRPRNDGHRQRETEWRGREGEKRDNEWRRGHDGEKRDNEWRRGRDGENKWKREKGNYNNNSYEEGFKKTTLSPVRPQRQQRNNTTKTATKDDQDKDIDIKQTTTTTTTTTTSSNTNNTSNTTDHVGSLFIKRNGAIDDRSKDVFTSKVFSLSSQTNKLIIKEGSTETRKIRSYGRGRGRIVRDSLVNSSSSPGGLRNINQSDIGETDKMKVSVKVKETDSTPPVRAPPVRPQPVRPNNDTPVIINEEPPVDKDGVVSGSKPKRYSSRRQKIGDNEEINNKESPEKSGIDMPIDNATNDNMNIYPSYQQVPHPSQSFVPYQWPIPPPFQPVMYDPMTQQQLLMAMHHQQMAMFQNSMLYHHHHPDGTPSGTAEPILPTVPSGYLPVPSPAGPNINGESKGIPPDHQKMMHSPSQAQKLSQAIPIVSPANINEL